MVDCQINDSVDNFIKLWRREASFGHIHVHDHESMKRFL